MAVDHDKQGSPSLMTSFPKGATAIAEAVRLSGPFLLADKMIFERVEIYALCDPDTGRVRYIGKAKDSQKRLEAHLRERRRKYPVYAWIAKLKESGKIPVVVVLAVSIGDWRLLEAELITQYRLENSDLLNVADGGDEPSCTQEQRSRNAKKLNDAIESDPYLKNIRRLRKSGVDALRSGNVRQDTKDIFLYCATVRPDLFGAWLKYF